MAMGEQNFVQALKTQATLEDLLLGPFPTVQQKSVLAVQYHMGR